MKLAKPLIFGGVVAASLIVIGGARIAMGPSNESANDLDPDTMLGEVNRAVRGARDTGWEQGMREATSPKSLDAALSTRSATLDSALELAISDIDSLACARAGQYLSSARDAQANGAADVERWLLNQLNQENRQIKELMATHGSMDGSATNASALDSPLRNRAAILMALNALYVGESPSCRVAAFDSATQIDSFAFEANRIKENQQRAMKGQVEEVQDGDS